MEPKDIKQVVAAELQAGIIFNNFHGISPHNLQSFLVEPYEVMVDPDDLEQNQRPMWVVLHERQQPREGYVVVFDPKHSSWGIAEFTSEAALTLVISAATLAKALDGM